MLISKQACAILALMLGTVSLGHAHGHETKPSQPKQEKLYRNRVHTFKDASLKLLNPKVRKAKKGQTSAGFVKIINSSDKDITILKASSPIAETVELHTSFEENGVHKMRPVSEIVIPAKSNVELKSGGYHVMFIGLKHDLEIGQHVPVILETNSGKLIEATYKVQGMCGCCTGKKKKNQKQKNEA